MLVSKGNNLIEKEGMVPGNLHYDLRVALKGGKKERQDGLHEDQD
jgi:hypothetical protein